MSPLSEAKRRTGCRTAGQDSPPVSDRFAGTGLPIRPPPIRVIYDIEQLIDCIDARTVDARPTDRQGRPGSLQLEVQELTPKQWETLELAGKRGYFDRPRRVDLEALAEELSISKSAVSQRHRAAESTLVRAVLDASREREPAD